MHHFSEQVEYQFVDRLTIVGVPFGGLKRIEINTIEL